MSDSNVRSVPVDSDERRAALLAELLALPEAEQGARLVVVAAGDATLHLELQSLAGAARRAPGFLGGGALDDPLLVRGLRPGSVIGRYTLLARIGEGGMGTVYRALQREPIVREVALKVVRDGLDSAQVVARFEIERQALAVMDHPSIARVYDAGTAPGGRPYFVMELVDGVTLTEHCDRACLAVPLRLALFRQVCLAVQHAHAKGIVHRDLKPGNVLVTLVDGTPVPKVIDFGIAKASRAGAPHGEGLTVAWQRLGTPEYMSPEQAVESDFDVDTRTDVYSLGVLLYELLTGTTPLVAEVLRQQPWSEVERIIREVDPPTPSTRVAARSATTDALSARSVSEPRRLATLLRGDLDWIVMRCLEKERGRRYPTAEALAADIERHLAGDPVTAAPPSRAYRALKFAGKHRVAVRAGALVIGALALGVVGTSMGMLRAEERRRETELALRDADELVSFLERMLRSVQANVALGRDTTLLREIVDRAAQSLDAGELAVGPDAVVRLRRTLGATYANIAAFDAAEPMLISALDAARARAPRDEASVATCLEELAGFFGLYLRQFERAEPLAREALGLRRRLARGDDRTLARSIRTTAGVLEGRGDLEGAEALHAEGLAMLRRLTATAGTSECDAELALALHGMAGILDEIGQPTEAEHLYRESLALRERLYEGDHTEVANGLNNLAGVREKVGRAVDAEPMYRRALEMRQRLHGGDHPDVFVSLNNMAYVLQACERLDEAEPFYLDALAMARRLYDGDHPFVLSSLSNLAGYSLSVGRHAAAEPLFAEVLERRRRLFPRPHASLARSVTNYATVLERLDRRADAEPYFREAAELFEAVYGPDHHDTARAKAGLAANLVRLDRAGEAKPLYRDALAVYERTFPGDHARTATVLGLIAQCLAAQEEVVEALDFAQRAVDMFTRLGGATHADTVKAVDTLAKLRARQTGR